ncbi:dirigent protein 24-like [Prosopis cineraria]|uniref:dirigent protein 24-like n=1 Tax=Prosopis cineraria TaxID=364024 RepID=UPI00240F7956|nr:dirigent protein 24-like [Prosopis cineraria]
MASFIDQSSSTRTLTNNIPAQNLNLSHSHLHKFTFLMPHILDTALSRPSSTNDFPFSEPLETSPTTTEIPESESPSDQNLTLDLSSLGFLFPTKTTLQDLQLGKITLVEQELLREVDDDGLDKFGKAEGVYVGRSEDGTSYMMALTVNFEEEDGLRLYGEQRSDVLESHVAVIGGTGKYEDANGYASVKVVERVGFSKQEQGQVTSTKFLSFHVYLI